MKKCKRCVMKHLTTAYGLLAEVDYPAHQWLAIGQLVLAEWESPDGRDGRQIREVRLIVEESLIDNKSVHGLILPLITKVIDSDISTTTKPIDGQTPIKEEPLG